MVLAELVDPAVAGATRAADPITVRSSTGCGFLFAFHINYGSILHHFGDKARYWSKIVIFSYPLAFDDPVRAVPVRVVP